VERDSTTNGARAGDAWQRLVRYLR
jgi:hypothetical protein